MEKLRQCRICLVSEGANTSSIYAVKNEEYLPAVVYNISGVKILKRLEPEAKICSTCAAAVVSAQTIILRCQESEEFLCSQKYLEGNLENRAGGISDSAAEITSPSQEYAAQPAERNSEDEEDQPWETETYAESEIAKVDEPSKQVEMFSTGTDKHESASDYDIQVMEGNSEEEEDQLSDMESYAESEIVTADEPKKQAQQVQRVSVVKNKNASTKREGTAAATVFSCDRCGFSTKIGRTLIEHKLQQHNIKDRNIYKCSYCTERFAWKPKLYRHIEAVHETLPEDKKFFCNKCGNSYTREIHLIEHTKQRHGPRRFKCAEPNCERTFTRAFTLRRHFLCAHSNETRYHCAECNKYFKIYDLWKYHNEVVHKNNIVYCPRCGYPFRQKKKLDEHLQKEVCKGSVIPCPYCQRRFTARPGLKEHVKRIHRLP